MKILYCVFNLILFETQRILNLFLLVFILLNLFVLSYYYYYYCCSSCLFVPTCINTETRNFSINKLHLPYAKCENVYLNTKSTYHEILYTPLQNTMPPPLIITYCVYRYTTTFYITIKICTRHKSTYLSAVSVVIILC